jgi:alcohol dehydrogenase (cytochrome c)
MYAKTTLVQVATIWALTFVAAINAAGLSATPVFAVQGQKFTAKLTGQNEIPPKDTKATGSFEMELSADGTLSNYVLNVTNISDITLAHIHEGEKGVNGPIIVTLYKSANPTGTSNGTLSQGKVYSKLFEGPFAGKYISDLMKLINDGKAYVNVYTKQNPQGEIRGQLSNVNTTKKSVTTIEIPKNAQNPSSDQFYIPRNARVAAGSQVSWINKDIVQHTATADDGSFDSGLISPGQKATITVDSQGTKRYHCLPHPWMTATLLVSSAGSTAGGGGPSTSSTTPGAPSTLPATSSTESFAYRTMPQVIKTLSKSTISDKGTETKHIDNWLTANHDIYGTRSSNQTTLNKNNVNTLQPKWILKSEFPIENPPLIVGDRGYVQDNSMRVIAFDVNTGLNIWNFDVQGQQQQLPSFLFSHGLTYDNGVIFTPTGANGTVVALNSTDGKVIWQSAAIGDPRQGYRLPTPPLVWKDYVVVGSALGDEPPFAPAPKGTITAFNRTNGERIWNMTTVIGPWVQGNNSKLNGGGTSWSGGSLDPDTGIVYMPAGNPAPDFNATTRQGDQKYTNHMLAINITNGKIIWATPFLEKGTVLPNVTLPETHDWDLSWGSNLVKVKSNDKNSSVIEKILIGHDKRGDIMAMDAATGKPLWWNVIGTLYRTYAIPRINGSGEVWPGSQYGIQAYSAVDKDTVYVASSSMGFNFFVNGTSVAHVDPVFDSIANGVGNGTITAMDIKTGKIKWQHPTEFPTWVSPLVTNGIVFSGHITATGKPYKFNDFGAPSQTPLISSGIIMALDKDTGKTLWQYNVGAPIGIGGPSIGHRGMLFVTTGIPVDISSNTGGYVVAFGLPPSPLSPSNSSQSSPH